MHRLGRRKCRIDLREILLDLCNVERVCKRIIHLYRLAASVIEYWGISAR